jgi:spore coat protein H
MSSSKLTRLCGFLVGALLAWRSPAAVPDSSDGLFTNASILRLQLHLPAENIEQLRDNPRRNIPATVRAGTNVWRDVGVHIKGSIGSFRSIDGKPSLTLSFDKFLPDQRFEGLSKIHLNNSVEDPSYLNELLGNELFRAAGLPAPRVTHAVVHINERRLGIYVVKEGFTEEFLARYYRKPEGNLYDITRDAHDVNEPMAKDIGRGPDDHSDLEMLTVAALEPDLALRWERLRKTLDTEQFLSFMAMEVLIGHRDGYCLARNNFRVYQNVDSNRMVFFPHGMDVLFGNARAPLQPFMNGLVARAIMEIPEARLAYRPRCAELFTNVVTVSRTSAIIDAALPRIRSGLTAGETKAFEHELAMVRQRIALRVSNVHEQLMQAPLQPLRFEDHVAVVSGWQPVDVPDGGSLTRTTDEGKPALAIAAGPVTSASWRTKVLLPRGRYRFDATLRTSHVEALPFGKNHGATLRVSGAMGIRPQALLGDKPWTTLSLPFEVKEREQEVELICELRARRGTAWFAADSLRVFQGDGAQGP